MLVLFGCSIKSAPNSLELPEVSLVDEEEEIFFQKKILINEMISSSKILHKISWPILKKNKDICFGEGAYSFGVLYATKEDLPNIDSKYFGKILNNNIKPSYFKTYAVDSFPVIVSVALNSPASKSNFGKTK